MFESMRGCCTRWAVAITAVLVVAGPIVARPQQATAKLDVTATPAVLHQGDVTLLTVSAPRPLVALEGEAFGGSIATWAAGAGDDWQALVGVPLEAPSRTWTVNLQGLDADGATLHGRARLGVRRGTFGTRRVNVNPRFANPPASAAARIAAEAERLVEILGRCRPARLWRGPFSLPVPGAATSGFGRRTVLNGKPRGRHQGTDLRAAEGTPVAAPNAGEVVLADALYLAGNTVVIDHGSGLYSLLAHLSRMDVDVGEAVARGQIVGAAGSTGRVSGPHLHWAVQLRGTTVNPLSLVSALTSAREPEAHEGGSR